jgi:ATP-dependent exoDNAse (exonuclease V) beta subunit
LLCHIEDISVAPVREGEAPLEPEAADVLTLMTWHAAKGLEKEMVILADLSHRRPTGMPRALVDQTGHLGLKLTFQRVAESGKAAAETWNPVEEQRETERQAESEEEKRMLYVAMTRAQEYLVLSGLRPEDVETCGVRLAQVIADARPGLVRVEQIPAAADTPQVPLEGTEHAQEDSAEGEEEANRR